MRRLVELTAIVILAIITIVGGGYVAAMLLIAITGYNQ
jgi:hypothetical protein